MNLFIGDFFDLWLHGTHLTMKYDGFDKDEIQIRPIFYGGIIAGCYCNDSSAFIFTSLVYTSVTRYVLIILALPRVSGMKAE